MNTDFPLFPTTSSISTITANSTDIASPAPFTTTTNLRRHVGDHGLLVADTKPGPLRDMEQRIVMKFYDSAKAKHEDLDAVSQAQRSNAEYLTPMSLPDWYPE
ncbi:hypothetical protein PENARI_c022G06802 [Penicillium arizonense]|uniref:Uncharacterized protein n=1 Tax=Penicillium arizonense TaxID=1835702 RepID=A0A1F5L8E3_PENAI|nr:hypothetical protein PENARI_c022G06802 [Penicillium arizonense]OGE49229.1 hypothetical protein PENARI_c022G06802 [Penicillium arizonense]